MTHDSSADVMLKPQVQPVWMPLKTADIKTGGIINEENDKGNDF